VASVQVTGIEGIIKKTLVVFIRVKYRLRVLWPVKRDEYSEITVAQSQGKPKSLGTIVKFNVVYQFISLMIVLFQSLLCSFKACCLILLPVVIVESPKAGSGPMYCVVAACLAKLLAASLPSVLLWPGTRNNLIHCKHSGTKKKKSN